MMNAVNNIAAALAATGSGKSEGGLIKATVVRGPSGEGVFTLRLSGGREIGVQVQAEGGGAALEPGRKVLLSPSDGKIFIPVDTATEQPAPQSQQWAQAQQPAQMRQAAQMLLQQVQGGGDLFVSEKQAADAAGVDGGTDEGADGAPTAGQAGLAKIVGFKVVSEGEAHADGIYRADAAGHILEGPADGESPIKDFAAVRLNTVNGQQVVTVIAGDGLQAALEELRGSFESPLLRALPVELLKDIFNERGYIDTDTLKALDAALVNRNLSIDASSRSQMERIGQWLRIALDNPGMAAELVDRIPALGAKDAAGLLELIGRLSSGVAPESFFATGNTLRSVGANTGGVNLLQNLVKAAFSAAPDALLNLVKQIDTSSVALGAQLPPTEAARVVREITNALPAQTAAKPGSLHDAGQLSPRVLTADIPTAPNTQTPASAAPRIRAGYSELTEATVRALLGGGGKADAAAVSEKITALRDAVARMPVIATGGQGNDAAAARDGGANNNNRAESNAASTNTQSAAGRLSVPASGNNVNTVKAPEAFPHVNAQLAVHRASLPSGDFNANVSGGNAKAADAFPAVNRGFVSQQPYVQAGVGAGGDSTGGINTNSINTNSINANSVNANGVNANSINTNGINTNSVNTNSVNANGVNTNSVNANSVNANSVNANSVNTNSVNANSVNVNSINTNSVNTNSVNTNSVNANGVNANGINTNSVNPNSVNTNSINTNSVNPNSVNANSINTNSVNTNSINTNSINPNGINSVDNRSIGNANTNANGNIGPADNSAGAVDVNKSIPADNVRGTGVNTGGVNNSGGAGVNTNVNANAKPAENSVGTNINASGINSAADNSAVGVGINVRGVNMVGVNPADNQNIRGINNSGGGIGINTAAAQLDVPAIKEACLSIVDALKSSAAPILRELAQRGEIGAGGAASLIGFVRDAVASLDEALRPLVRAERPVPPEFYERVAAGAGRQISAEAKNALFSQIGSAQALIRGAVAAAEGTNVNTNININTNINTGDNANVPNTNINTNTNINANANINTDTNVNAASNSTPGDRPDDFLQIARRIWANTEKLRAGFREAFSTLDLQNRASPLDKPADDSAAGVVRRSADSLRTEMLLDVSRALRDVFSSVDELREIVSQLSSGQKALPEAEAALLRAVRALERQARQSGAEVMERLKDVLRELNRLQADAARAQEQGGAAAARSSPAEAIRSAALTAARSLENLQLLSTQTRAAETEQHLLALPAKIGGEWTEVQIKFVKERKGEKGENKDGHVSIYLNVAPSALGQVTAHLDYHPPNLKLAFQFEKPEVTRWFRQQSGELREALSLAGLPGTALEFHTKRPVGGDPAVPARPPISVDGGGVEQADGFEVKNGRVDFKI